ncbi:MAG: GAF domain-containing protein [Ignavibacteriae bacterium]|nr:GAF domain-containing protein [Ignavibacteriota bacterium]
MFLNSRNKKRILIFLIIPLLAIIPLLTNDFNLKAISAVVLIVYVAFIIFLRDSVRIKNMFEDDYIDDDQEEYVDSEENTFGDEAHEDSHDGFEIISKGKDAEVITSSTYKPTMTAGLKSNVSDEEIKKQFVEIISEELPQDVNSDEQFIFVLEKILNVIKEAYLANTVIFFWYNDNKQELSLQKYFSNNPGSITKNKFSLEDDIISKIVHNQEPIHLNEISANAEMDVIRYYDSPQGIKSLVGVPLFYGETLTGVLVVDAKVPDAFGVETVYSLGRFVRIISIIISLFDEKFSGTSSENRLNILLNILKTDRKFATDEDIKEVIDYSIKNLIHWDAFSFVYFEPEDQKFFITKTENKLEQEYFEEGEKVELDGTLVGKAVVSGIPVNIEDTEKSKFVRFRKDEKESLGGSFLALPLVYDNQNFGVLCFESSKKNIYNNSDVKFMKNAVKIFSFFVYTYSTHAILKNLLSVDIETKALTYDAFVSQTSSDLVKAEEVDADGAVALIQIDDFMEERSLFETDPFPNVLDSITQVIKSEITLLNNFGRLGEKLFAVYFFNSSTKDVFLWAEKLRIKIARKPISVVSKQTTFTVSIGVASANHKTNIDEILNNAELALNKALEKGGNTVKSIN